MRTLQKKCKCGEICFHRICIIKQTKHPYKVFVLFYHNLLYKYLLQYLYRAVYLLLCMCRHERISYQRVCRSASRRHDRIDEHATLESKGRDEECLVHIAHVKRYDRRFRVSYLKALVLETLESIVRDIPQLLYYLRFFLQDIKCLLCGSRRRWGI